MLTVPALLAATTLLGPVAAPALSAEQQATCTYDNPSKTVTITIANTVEPTFILLTAEGGVISYQEINLQTFQPGPKQPCGSATTSNTDLIRVQGGGPSGALLVVDETTGPFAPGFTAETTGVSEIEFEFQSIGGIFYGGSNAPTLVRLGTLGANINGDDDVDVTLLGSPAVFGYFGGAGADDIAATGGYGTGDVSGIDFLAAGGDGSDRLVAGTGRAQLNGLGGNDFVVGGPAGDIATGDAGNDRISGGAGSDNLQGAGGKDVLRGGPSRDSLNGGPGKDKCVGGPGKDELAKCER